jgi:uncharacterized protein YciI
MSTYTIEYTYDDRAEERNAVRPDHLNYLNGLVSAGTMLAFGRYNDDGEPGALLIVEAVNSDAVENLVRNDPYVIAGLVPSHDIRSWPAIWGAIRT